MKFYFNWPSDVCNPIIATLAERLKVNHDLLSLPLVNVSLE